MKTRIQTGKQTKIKINRNFAEPAGIRNGDIYDVQLERGNITLKRSQDEE
jgi:hypothetical protein